MCTACHSSGIRFVCCAHFLRKMCRRILLRHCYVCLNAVCVCVCVCVWERERARERLKISESACKLVASRLSPSHISVLHSAFLSFFFFSLRIRAATTLLSMFRHASLRRIQESIVSKTPFFYFSPRQAAEEKRTASLSRSTMNARQFYAGLVT